jgi:hydrogenase maturation factor HypF (carbamoyltransferase family)
MPLPKIIKQLRKDLIKEKINKLYEDSGYCMKCKDKYRNKEDKRHIKEYGLCSSCYYELYNLKEIIEIL